MDAFEKRIVGLPGQLDAKTIGTANLAKLGGRKPDVIVVCGMGGSGLVGDMLAETASAIGLPVPVITVKEGRLPALPFKRPLYICISFSGDTEETLACLAQALREKAAVAVITGKGGKMRALAEKHRLPAAFFPPQGLTPRTASGRMYVSSLSLIRRVFPRTSLPRLSSQLRPAALKPRGETLARRLKDRNILVYTSAQTRALGYFWKISLNETGKHAAFWNIYPELNHNEIVGFGRIKGPWTVVWLEDPASGKRTLEKTKFVAARLARQGIKSERVALPGRTAFERLWNGVILAEWTSLALAKLQGDAPDETKSIDELKRTFQGK